MGLTCKKCGVTKPIGEFVKDNGKPNGYRNICKICRSKYAKEWGETNKERNKLRRRLWQKQYYKDFPDKLKIKYERHKETHRKWYLKNREYVLKKVCEWAKKNPEKVKESRKRYIEKNHDKELIRSKLYRKQNKEKIKLYREQNRDHLKELHREWYKNNREYCLNKCKLYYESNREYINKKHRESYKINPELYLKKNKYYRELNKDQYLKLERLRTKKYTANLSDRYIKHLIISNTGLNIIQISKELIESYRQQIKIKRLLKQKKIDNPEYITTLKKEKNAIQYKRWYEKNKENLLKRRKKQRLNKKLKKHENIKTS